MPAAKTDPKVKRPGPPHVFGRGLRERILMLLATNSRPLYVTEIANLLKVDGKKVRNALDVLCVTNVIIKSSPPHGARFVALNPLHPAYHPLLRYLRVSSSIWPQPKAAKPARRAERLELRNFQALGQLTRLSDDQLYGVFSSEIRSKILFALAFVFEADGSQIKRLVSGNARSVTYSTLAMIRGGVLQSRIVGARRVYALANVPGQSELRRLLRLFARHQPGFIDPNLVVEALTKRWR